MRAKTLFAAASLELGAETILVFKGECFVQPLQGVQALELQPMRHVLAVDDEAVQRYLLEIFFGQRGWHVTSASDGAAALAAARLDPPRPAARRGHSRSAGQADRPRGAPVSPPGCPKANSAVRSTEVD